MLPRQQREFGSGPVHLQSGVGRRPSQGGALWADALEVASNTNRIEERRETGLYIV